MALQVKVKCAKCNWVGSREQSSRHVCASKVHPSNAPQDAPSASTAHSWTGNGAPPPQATYQPQPQPPAYSYNMDNFPSYPQPSGGPGVYMAGGPPRPPTNSPAQPPNNGYATSNNANYYNNNYNRPPPPQPSAQRPPGPSRRRYEVIEPVGSCPWTLYGIGQEEYDQIVSIFVFFDQDDSGTLEKNEVARLARWLNFSRTDNEVERIFMDMDSNGSGSLTIGEFLTWLKYNKPNPQALYGLTQSQYNTIMMQFHMYDTDQDGLLLVNEFTRLVMNLGDVKSVEIAERLFGMIDKDRDGRINIHDFLIFRAGKA
ncbi:hypothetical protein STCU_01687 [Strigomonas culicis]|nr:hypothetical protein STCU_01687 [Strigomonas culicis]|eukprot:EPY34283.1 hypothetical protein STCU_01687 [Strigomonas culicis]